MAASDVLGRAAELKVQIFGGRSNERTLQEEIRAWLETNGGVEVHDIQYRYQAESGQGWYSAMIIYR